MKGTSSPRSPSATAAARRRNPRLLVGQALVLTVFMVVAIQESPCDEGDDPHVLAAGLLASAAMAIQNTAARAFLSGLPPTTVMAGNFIRVVVDIVDQGRDSPHLPPTVFDECPNPHRQLT